MILSTQSFLQVSYDFQSNLHAVFWNLANILKQTFLESFAVLKRNLSAFRVIWYSKQVKNGAKVSSGLPLSRQIVS